MAITASLTITDDPPVISMSVENTKEGDDLGYILFTRSGGDISAALPISYTLGGTATNGTDYTTISTSVTIGAGNTYADVEIDPTSDLLAEMDETVTLTIAPGSTYILAGEAISAMATLVIEDNASTATTLIHQETFALTDSGTSQLVNVTLTVTLNAPGAADKYTWEYVVSSPSSNTDNWTTVTIPVEDMDADVGGVTDPSGWSGSVGGSSVSWIASGAGISPGGSAIFKFTSDPRGVGPDTIEATAAGATVVADLPTAPAPRQKADRPLAVIQFVPGLSGHVIYTLKLDMTDAIGNAYTSGNLNIATASSAAARDLVYTFLLNNNWKVEKIGASDLAVLGRIESDATVTAIKSLTWKVTAATTPAPTFQPQGQVAITEAP